MAYTNRVCNYFIMKHYRFFTTAISIGFASTVHKSFKECFKIAPFGVIQAMIDTCWCSIFRFWNNVTVLL